MKRPCESGIERQNKRRRTMTAPMPPPKDAVGPWGPNPDIQGVSPYFPFPQDAIQDRQRTPGQWRPLAAQGDCRNMPFMDPEHVRWRYPIVDAPNLEPEQKKGPPDYVVRPLTPEGFASLFSGVPGSAEHNAGVDARARRRKYGWDIPLGRVHIPAPRRSLAEANGLFDRLVALKHFVEIDSSTASE
jgi:hypothetical protein